MHYQSIARQTISVKLKELNIWGENTWYNSNNIKGSSQEGKQYNNGIHTCSSEQGGV